MSGVNTKNTLSGALATSTLSLEGMSSYDGATRLIDSNAPLYSIENRVSSFAYIVCLLGSKELIGKYWRINLAQKVSIGRSRLCDIQIQTLSISNKHINLYVTKKTATIKDLKSTNGTLVDNKNIEVYKEIELSDNSTIQLGTIVCKFLAPGNPEIISVIENFKRSFEDPLTKIGNKLMLDQQGEELFQQSKQYKTDLSFILFDIDHFKKVNDVYGHLTGDFVLQEVASFIKNCFRSNDIVVRCGGEEFCIIIKSIAKQAAQSIEKARQKLAKHVFQYKDNNITITISAGVTQRIKTDKNWKHIYGRADKLLYKSKNGGRNKVSCDF